MDEAAQIESTMPQGGIDDMPVSDADLSDDEAARLARERYRAGIPLMQPDTLVEPHLEDGEQPLDFSVPVSIRSMDGLMGRSAGDEGMLYVTNRRLLHLGRRTTSIPLFEIAELTVTLRSLLIGLTGSGGVILDVAQPRRLRVLIVAAISAARR